MEAVGQQSRDEEIDPLKSHVVSILLATTIVQTFTTWANLVFTPAATVLAREFELPATAIGYQVGLVLFSAMCCSLIAGSITIAIGARLTLQLALLISGTGDVIETVDDLIAIGSGGMYAQSAARALFDCTEMSARDIVEKSLGIAGDICIYTNQTRTIEEL